MIEWTFNGIATWLLARKELFVFYGILGAIFFGEQRRNFASNIKNLIYSFFFISLVVGMWEMPLVWFTSPYGIIWTFNLILYMVPFPIICVLFKIKFQFGKKEKLLFFVWCMIAVISFGTNYLLNIINPAIWNYGVSYIFRALTFIFLFFIFRRMTVTDVRMD